MQYDAGNELPKGLADKADNILRDAASGISAKVRQKYGMIDLAKVPDHVNYAKVERYLRSINVEITRRMFITYLNEELLPDGHEVKNSRYSFYTREQIIYYILIDMFKPILPLGKVKVLFTEILSPIIADIGLDAAFEMMRRIIVFMSGRFEDAMLTAAARENLNSLSAHPDSAQSAPSEETPRDIGPYISLLTLCMAKGGLDCYMCSPFALPD